MQERWQTSHFLYNKIYKICSGLKIVCRLEMTLIKASYALNNIVYGGKNFYGSAVGILMLETKFPRVCGDIGNGVT